MRVVLSVPWTSPWNELPSAGPVHVLTRQVTWQASRAQYAWHLLRDGLRLLVVARRADVVVISTGAAEMVVGAILLRLLPSVRLAVYDVLLPRSERSRTVMSWALRRVDVWTVIRRGDAGTFAERLAAGPATFVPFPVVDAPLGEEAGGFIYAAGTAHRDWPTLVEAVRITRIPTCISTDAPLQVPGDLDGCLTLLGILDPETGRGWARRASAVCVPLVDTELPSGPLVVLDAMRAGKPVVASDVNGTRDYVQDGVTGVLVTAGNPKALAHGLRAALGRDASALAQAARTATDALLPESVLPLLLEAVVTPAGPLCRRSRVRPRKRPT